MVDNVANELTKAMVLSVPVTFGLCHETTRESVKYVVTVSFKTDNLGY